MPQWFSDFLNDIDELWAAIGAKVESSLTALLDVALSPQMAALDAPSLAIQGTITSVARSLSDLRQKVISAITDQVRQIGRAEDATLAAIESDIRSQLTKIAETQAEIERSFIRRVFDYSSGVDEGIADLEATITGKITAASNEAQAVSDNQTFNILELLMPRIDLSLEEAEEVVGKATVLVEAAVLTSQGMIDLVGGQLGLGFGELATALTGQLSNFWGFDYSSSKPEIEDRLDPILQLIEAEESLPPEILNALRPGWIGAAFLIPIAVGAVLGTVIGGFASSYYAGSLEKVRIESFRRTRPALLSSVEILTLMNRNPDAEASLVVELESLGYKGNDINRLVQLRYVLLAAQDWVVLWRREEIDDAELDVQLGKLGYSEDEREALKKLAYPIPPVQDIIQMAVREVFSPEIAERFGQFEDIPDEYMIQAKRSGLTEEWARNVWAAHWMLPSIQQGFEMLHRRVIGEEDMASLMVALDVMPFWRDRLQQISYRTLTRVDVRRMHKTGALSEAEVKEAYLDFGYSELNAVRMTAFTVAYNEPKEQREIEEVRELTKSEVLLFLEEHIYTAEQAIGDLEAIGYSPEAAEALVSIRLLEEQIQERKEEVAVVEAAYKADAIDLNTAIERLDALGLHDERRDALVAKFERMGQAVVAFPSISQLESMLEENILNEDEALEAILHMGYAPKWADRLLYVMAQSAGRHDISRKGSLLARVRG